MELLQRSRLVLLGKSAATLPDIVAQQEQAGAAIALMRHRRQAFRQGLAPLVGVRVEELTLSRLADFIGGTAGQEVAQRRLQLLQLANQVEVLHRANAGLIFHCLDFYNRFFDDLAGTHGARRYGPAGRYQEAACGSLLNTRG